MFRFIPEPQPKHQTCTGQPERESHPDAHQSPAKHKAAKISYGQRYNKIGNKGNDHHRFNIRNATQGIGKVDLQSITELVDQERNRADTAVATSVLSVNQPPTWSRRENTMLSNTTSIQSIR